MLEPIRELLDAGIQSDRGETDERWKKTLRDEIKTAEVDVSTTLLTKRMVLNDILNFKEGDIVSIELPDHVIVESGEMPLFRGKLGISNDHFAVQLQEKVEREETKSMQRKRVKHE